MRKNFFVEMDDSQELKELERAAGVAETDKASREYFESLRRRARKLLKAMEIDSPKREIAGQVASLYQSLMEFHIELDLQQDELVQNRKRIEELMKENFVAFELAPFYYWKIDQTGCVHQFNLLGAELFEKPRKYLIPGKTPLTLVVDSGDHEAFSRFLRAVFRGGEISRASLRDKRGRQLEFSGREISAKPQRMALVAAFEVLQPHSNSLSR